MTVSANPPDAPTSNAPQSVFSNKSAAAKSGINQTLDPIETFIFAGLQKKILETFEIRTVWVTATDRMRALQRMFGSPNQGTNDMNIQYPFGFLTLVGLNEVTDRVNRHALAYYGPIVSISTDGNKAFRAKLTPIEFQIKFTYITNSYKDILKAAPLTVLTRQLGWLKFNVIYGRSTYGISVIPDGQVSIPTQENDMGSAKEYEMDINILMYGFVSSPTLVEQGVARAIDVNVALQPPLLTSAPNASNTTSFWSFNTLQGSTAVSDTVPSIQNRSE